MSPPTESSQYLKSVEQESFNKFLEYVKSVHTAVNKSVRTAAYFNEPFLF